MGAPTKYYPKLAKQAEKLAQLGATDSEIADFLEINLVTLHRWKVLHKDFCKALKVGKEAADERVERSLYHKALGYSHPEDKLFCHEGKVIVHETTKHYPPDYSSIALWLKNRKPDEWRDKQEVEVTGLDGAMSALDRGRERASKAKKPKS